MKKQHNCDFSPTTFAANLVAWYRQNARPLPWRDTTDPYAIWVSEVMLQQTRVETVIPYYHRFLALFPTVEALASAAEAAVVKAWEGLGYYRRARLLHQGAQFVQTRLGGNLPSDPCQLALIPGVGSYMTGSLASIAFNMPVPAVDGNVVRVATRILAWEKDPGTAESRKMIDNWAQQLYPGQKAGELTQALMELGALICLPSAPDCPQCPVGMFCKAIRLPDQGPESYPRRRKPRANPIEHRIALRITWNGKQLYLQRAAEGLMAGFWEYPNLKAAQDAEPQKLAEDWCSQQFGAPLELTYEKTVTHVFTHLTWLIDIYQTAWLSKIPPRALPDSQWLSREEAAKLPRVAYARDIDK